MYTEGLKPPTLHWQACNSRDDQQSARLSLTTTSVGQISPPWCSFSLHTFVLFFHSCLPLYSSTSSTPQPFHQTEPPTLPSWKTAWPSGRTTPPHVRTTATIWKTAPLYRRATSLLKAEGSSLVGFKLWVACCQEGSTQELQNPFTHHPSFGTRKPINILPSFSFCFVTNIFVANLNI